MADEMMATDERLAATLARETILVEDGALGTMIQAAGVLEPGEAPYEANKTHPEAVTAIHRAYVEAGAQVVITNTFGATRRALKTDDAVEVVNRAAVACARAAGPALVAGDIGPLGELLEPYGDLEPEEALDLFTGQAAALAAAGCDLFTIETMADPAEAALAVRAVRSVSPRPIFVTMTFGETGRTFMGAAPEDALNALAPLDIQAIGANCSVGPDRLRPIIEGFATVLANSGTPLPIIAKPNAGMPQRGQTGEVAYDLGPDAFAAAMKPLIDAGATIVGGCCGTSPAYIAALVREMAAR